MPLLRAVVLPGLGVIAVLAAAGRAMRLLGGDDPREDRAVRALQDAFGHRSDDGDAAVATDPADPTGPREPIDRVTEPALVARPRRKSRRRRTASTMRSTPPARQSRKVLCLAAASRCCVPGLF